jgi:hypothetical protein
MGILLICGCNSFAANQYQKLHKVSHFQFRKTYIKKLSSTKSNNFVEYSIRYAIDKGGVFTRLNNRRKDLAYIHFL